MNDKANLLALPVETLNYIFTFLKKADLFKLRRVCKQLEILSNQIIFKSEKKESSLDEALKEAINQGDKSLVKFFFSEKLKLTDQQCRNCIQFINKSLAEVDQTCKRNAIHYEQRRLEKADYRWTAHEIYESIMNRINAEEESSAQYNSRRENNLNSSKKLFIAIRNNSDQAPVRLLKKFGVIGERSVAQEVPQERSSGFECVVV